MTAAQARALCPDLILAPTTPADIPAAEAALIDVSFGFADRIESEPGRTFFEVGDLGHLYPEGEHALGHALRARAAQVGLEVHVAIASNKGVGRLLSRVRALTVVPAGAEAATLAPLACRSFGEELDTNTRVTLERWGVRTLGSLAALPAEEVTLRLGSAGLAFHRLARGESHEPFLPRPPADAVEESLESEYPLVELEPLSFLLRGLLERLMARLTCRGLACAGISLRLTLESRGFDLRNVPLAAPTRESASVLQLLRLDLARRPPDHPVVGLTVVALPARVRATQLDFLRPAGPRPDRLAATVSRLAALVGAENVGHPRPTQSWREETSLMAPPRYETLPSTMPSSGVHASPGASIVAEPGQLTIHRFRPSQEVEVLWDREGPSALRHSTLAVRILIAAGPYRVEGEWWQSASSHAPALSRDYWDVHASDGAVYRVHQDRSSRRWYLDGYYD